LSSAVRVFDPKFAVTISGRAAGDDPALHDRVHRWPDA
jgi:hypothetical protein